MRRVAVIGVGVTKFGKHERTSAELFAEAAADALLDAELPASAVPALYDGNVVGSEPEHRLHAGPQAGSILGIPAIPTARFETACASSHAAFRHAVMEIAAGVSDVVLVGGAERVLNVPTPESTEYFAYASDAGWEQTLGLTFPGVFALIARAHMQKYGTTEEQMAAVAVKNHKHGTLNPKAQFQKEISVEQVLKSATYADFSTCSTLISFWTCAFGLSVPCLCSPPPPRRTGCSSATSVTSPACPPPSAPRPPRTDRRGSVRPT